ncbi:hypothetical protein REPUB_Repub14bG0139900 [Reevesia pubescens]
MGSSRLKYATGEADLTAFQKIFSLMQCTPNLSQKDCESCLRELVISYQTCCHGKQGGAAKNPNCWFRWDLYPFYVSNPTTTAPSLSPPPPPASPPPPPQSVNSTSTKLVILAIVVLIKRRKKFEKTKEEDENYKNRVESLQFDFSAIRVATENFSDANMLGQCGFGPVYKGIGHSLEKQILQINCKLIYSIIVLCYIFYQAKLYNGQEVAVKRLSGNSGQGEKEFKNEVLLLAKLQHRNLVRLLGFSMEQKERILIYDFLPNSSLDHFIFRIVAIHFESSQAITTKLGEEIQIIEGISKGLLYLHQDSQYRIIHRDLKAANILLDEEMNPKIADFGMAKLFAVNQSQADTSRIIGTFGYMAPEYTRHGQYSVKSDVYAFGVLILEIISGQKVNCFPKQEVGEYLLTYASRNWNEEIALELIDPILRDAPLKTSFSMDSIKETKMISGSYISDQSKSEGRLMIGNVKNAIVGLGGRSISGKQIHLNLATFNRQRKPVLPQRNAESQNVRWRDRYQPFLDTKKKELWNRLKRPGTLFKDALLSDKGIKPIPIRAGNSSSTSFFPTCQGVLNISCIHWLQYSIAIVTKLEENIASISKRLHHLKLDYCSVKTIGSQLFLVTLRNTEQVLEIESSGWAMFRNWCWNYFKWNHKISTHLKVARVVIKGLPWQAWSSDLAANALKDWGEPLCIENDINETEDLSKMFVLVLSKHETRISQKLFCALDHGSVLILLEEVEDVLKPSSEYFSQNLDKLHSTTNNVANKTKSTEKLALFPKDSKLKLTTQKLHNVKKNRNVSRKSTTKSAKKSCHSSLNLTTNLETPIFNGTYCINNGPASKEDELKQACSTATHRKDEQHILKEAKQAWNIGVQLGLKTNNEAKVIEDFFAMVRREQVP